MFDFALEYALLKEEYPDLQWKEIDNGYLFYGNITLDADFDNIPLYDEYSVEITVRNDFPESIPSISETGNNICEGFGHFCADKTLCLGAKCELLDFLENSPRLVSFVSHFLTSYLYTASYFKRYKCAPPYGERSHGLKGIKEAYLERYCITEETDLILCLEYIVGKTTFRGHSKCFCNSDKKFRDCHGAKILKDITSKNINEYQIDAYKLLIDYYKKLTSNKGGSTIEKNSSSEKQF